jgi:hypothetical protein
VRGTVAETAGRLGDAVRLYERAMSLGLADPELVARCATASGPGGGSRP